MGTAPNLMVGAWEPHIPEERLIIATNGGPTIIFPLCILTLAVPNRKGAGRGLMSVAVGDSRVCMRILCPLCSKEYGYQSGELNEMHHYNLSPRDGGRNDDGLQLGRLYIPLHESWRSSLRRHPNAPGGIVRTRLQMREYRNRARTYFVASEALLRALPLSGLYVTLDRMF